MCCGIFNYTSYTMFPYCKQVPSVNERGMYSSALCISLLPLSIYIFSTFWYLLYQNVEMFMKMKRIVMLQDLYEEQYVAIGSMSNCGSIFKICSYILYSDYLVAILWTTTSHACSWTVVELKIRFTLDSSVAVITSHLNCVHKGIALYALSVHSAHTTSSS